MTVEVLDRKNKIKLTINFSCLFSSILATYTLLIQGRRVNSPFDKFLKH